jgi:uncharacterized protein YjbI with pentapeptide repeats
MLILGVLVVIMILSCPQSALAQDCKSEKNRLISGKKLVEMLRSQQQILMDCTRVEGEIDLRGLGTTRGPFVLTNSIIDGPLIAPSTIFKGTVDFTKSTFSGKTSQSKLVDFHGSVFEGDVVWSRATFGALSENPPGIDFSGARFRGITDLRDAELNVPVQFQNATFEGRASFQQTQFRETVDFGSAAFDDRTSFMHSIFGKRVSFEGVNMAKDADFTGAKFFAQAIFRRLSVIGQLSMLDIYFEGKAILDEMSGGELKLGNNSFVEGVELSMADIRVDSLGMDLDDVKRIDDDDEKLAVLEILERTARNKGSTSTANDALFGRRVLENKKRGQPLQILNLIFNQGVAGYAVRPLHPLFSVLAVALLGYLVRLADKFLTLRVDERKITLRFNEESKTLRSAERVALSSEALGAALRAALAPKLNISIKPENRLDMRAYIVATAQWVEWASQKVLIGLFFIAIANSWPATKEFISSIFKL